MTPFRLRWGGAGAGLGGRGVSVGAGLDNVP